MLNNIPQVVILDDNVLSLEEMQRFLQQAYQNKIDVQIATSIEEAEAQMEVHSTTVDLLITDVMMPGGIPSGLDLATRMSPRIPVIVISAFPPDSFENHPDRRGPVKFLKKSSSKEFQGNLLAAVQKSILIKQFDDRMKTDSEELQNLCMARKRGAVLVNRFRLSELAPGEVPKVALRNLDFASVAFGSREWQKAIEQYEGVIYSIHDQSLKASFEDSGDFQEGFQAAVQSFCVACEATQGEWKAGFNECPFGAAAVPGMLVSGLFGRNRPGIPAIVGRIGDIASQMALHARSRELAVVRDWLVERRRRWFDALPCDQKRVETLLMANLTVPVEVTFFRP